MLVFHAFKNTMHKQRQLMVRLFADKGHPAQAGCLQVLAHADGMSQSDLAEMLHVSKPTVTTMLQKMERSGLIERRNDESDQRRTLIFVTPEGRRVTREIHVTFAKAFELSIGSMSDADKRELVRLLDEVSDNISKSLGDEAVAPQIPQHEQKGGRGL